jgi:hemerythrin-like domain-containing protein
LVRIRLRLLTPTEQLKQEHNAIKLMLKILMKCCDKLESGESVNPEDLEQMLDFIKVFVDRCHHAKEEDLLFPAMEKVGIPKEGGPIGVMLAEHDAGRKYVRTASDAIARYKSGDTGASAKIVESARAYVSLLNQHIDKEDNVLYRMADMRIPKQKQDELLEEFERVERERIGVGKHEQFHKLLEQLETTYLSPS